MFQIICGIDEAGRGPLAGPVTAAAVVLPPDFPGTILKDSKQLSPRKREKIARLLLSLHPCCYGIGWSWPEEIDRFNILEATFLAMRRAISILTPSPSQILVDGNRRPYFSVPTESIVKGDTYVPEIMAASILAKVARDKWMVRYSWIDNRYRFEKHKGYPTKEHREYVREHGLSSIHRRSFRTTFPA